MPNVSNFKGYFAIRMHKGAPNGFLLSVDPEKIKAWKERPPDHQIDKNDPELTVNTPIDKNIRTLLTEAEQSKPITLLILRFRDEMASIRAVTALITQATPGVQAAVINSNVIPYAKNNLSLIEEVDGVTTYSFSLDQYFGLIKVVKAYQQLEMGMAGLPSSLLMGLAATFDAHFSSLLRIFLAIHPERYENSTKPITMKDLKGLSSIGDVINLVIDSEIDGIMRGSHLEQVEFLEKALAVDIATHFEHLPKFIEFFERRNLAAQGNMVVNGIYLRNALDAKAIEPNSCEVGDTLDLTATYLLEAVDVLSELYLITAFRLWVKHVPDAAQDAFVQLNELCIGLLQDARFQLARNLLEYMANLKKGTMHRPPNENDLHQSRQCL